MSCLRFKLFFFSLFVSVVLSFAQTVWYNPLSCDTPYVCGRAWNAEIGKNFSRIPDRFQNKLPAAVWGLSKNSAGLSIRFCTTSRRLSIKYTLSIDGSLYRNMTPLNHSGIDLYAMDADGNQYWIGNRLQYHFGKLPTDTITFDFPEISIPCFENRGLEYELFLPPYNTVTFLSIGVSANSDFRFCHESAERPIVVYGSSITQGASPSRSGLMWTNILQREMDYPVINLGFSGSALMEPAVFDAIGEINARAFILDPMPNSYSLGDEIINRAIIGVKKLREKSDVPILLVESAGPVDSVLNAKTFRAYREGDAKFHQAYLQLKSQGLKNLFYMSFKDIGLTKDAMIDGIHPNDIGNLEYAEAYEKKIKEMFPEDMANKRYPPLRQRRDGVYEWLPRHNEVIRLNHTTNPEILMIGNSITHFWGGKPYSNNYGGNTWNKFFGKRRVINMGFGWDRIENVFWRIFHGELEGCHPKHICLLIGVNNISHNDSEEDVSDGVVALAKLIRERQPQAKLHVIKIYPAKNKEDIINRTNNLIAQKLVRDDHTDLVDLTSFLTLHDGSGRIDESLFREGLHPNEKGYAEIARGLKKYLK
ncbi:MAG: SGNH/GDSL hydrolase family protein [Bacteroidaceae bacterium]|nr:SGNH/GDSL hydrolase family protein [Bacteroidaceae bacterium]